MADLAACARSTHVSSFSDSSDVEESVAVHITELRLIEVSGVVERNFPLLKQYFTA